MGTEAIQIDALWSGINDPSNGKSYSGAIVATFASSTSTPKAVWEDKDKTLPSAEGKSQFTLDSNGQAFVFGDGAYKINIYAPTDTGLTNPLITIDGTSYQVLISNIVLQVDTISDLRNMTGDFQNQAVAIQGYYFVGDGGGGPLRYWDEGKASGTYTDNGGSIIVPTGGDGSEAWLWGDVSFIYPEWFGAKGDGVTDDSAAIINADTYLASLTNGGELILLPSTYKISNDIPFSDDVLVSSLNGAVMSVDSGKIVTFNGGFDGLSEQLTGAGSFARVENTTTISQHNAALDRIRTFQAGSFTVRQTPYGFLDAYQDSNGIDAGASANQSYDSDRTAFTPTRSQANTFYNDDFDTLTPWTDISSGTGGAAIVAYTGDPDPAIGSNGVELTTGATIGGVGAIEQDIGTIPDGQFGIMYIATLEVVGTAGSDALEIKLENDANKMLHIRHRDNAMEIYVDGAWQLIFALGGNYSTEWWVNAYNVGGGDHKIDVYAGAENVGTYTGALPAGTVDGRFTFKQNSGSANNRISQIWITQVGVTQVPDNLALVSIAKEAGVEPSKCRLSILLEDVSNIVDINTNFTASVSKDDGSTFEVITLVDQGVMELGEIDITKNVYLYTANHVFVATGDKTMRYKINVTANQFIAIQGVDYQWE